MITNITQKPNAMTPMSISGHRARGLDISLATSGIGSRDADGGRRLRDGLRATTAAPSMTARTIKTDALTALPTPAADSHALIRRSPAKSAPVQDAGSGSPPQAPIIGAERRAHHGSSGAVRQPSRTNS